MPTKAKAASHISYIARYASEIETMPVTMQANAPIPAAIPILILYGFFIMRNKVITNIMTEIIAFADSELFFPP